MKLTDEQKKIRVQAQVRRLLRREVAGSPTNKRRLTWARYNVVIGAPRGKHNVRNTGDVSRGPTSEHVETNHKEGPAQVLGGSTSDGGSET